MSDGITPLMAQYLDVKNQYKDCILFFRMGDFYELFFDDAIKASAALDITLTKRGKLNDQDIPMCGVPFHAYENYLARLIKQGFKVAICEQIENPADAKKRGYKEIVRRDVVRVVTPGTLTEDYLLPQSSHNFLLSVYLNKNQNPIIAWVDISTGDCFISSLTNLKDLTSTMLRLQPVEIIICQMQDSVITKHIPNEIHERITLRPSSEFTSKRMDEKLSEFFKIYQFDALLDLNEAEQSSLLGLLSYIRLTQKDKIPYLSFPKKEQPQDYMQIDASSRLNLEINQSQNGEKKYSLFTILNSTITHAGSRKLHKMLNAPLLNMQKINNRLDVVEFFIQNIDIRKKIQEHLQNIPDIERSLSRISLGRAGPRDLKSLEMGLFHAKEIANLLQIQNISNLHILYKIQQALSVNLNFIITLNAALNDELPYLARQGGFIKPNFDATIDEYHHLKNNSRRILLQMENEYKNITGINTLKIKHNHILGYHIDVPSAQASKLMQKTDTFIHRQTLATNTRFSTSQLLEIEKKITEADALCLERELTIFNDFCEKILIHASDIHAIAHAIAMLDVLVSFAYNADENNWTRPQFNEQQTIEIIDGRHPVVEKMLKTQNKNAFIPNDCLLNNNAFRNICSLITGPNMGGKSTFLRQNALILLMAQTGSFVPAAKTNLPIIDRLFCRVGASDNIAKGQSTFMVEMQETSAILNEATAKSFVVLDEIGRGTSTYDGLAIAFAVTEYLVKKINCLTLFATHYKELIDLTYNFHEIGYLSVTVEEHNNDLVFLHKVKQGVADKSYGVQVAKLAGMPKQVIKTATRIMKELDSISTSSASMPLFQMHDNEPEIEIQQMTPYPDPIIDSLKQSIAEIDLNQLTPLQALNFVHSLKEKI